MGGVTVGRHWQTNISGRYLPVKTDGGLKAVRLKDGGFDLDAVTLNCAVSLIETIYRQELFLSFSKGKKGSS
jgi:hypothetical protein